MNLAFSATIFTQHLQHVGLHDYHGSTRTKRRFLSNQRVACSLRPSDINRVTIKETLSRRTQESTHEAELQVKMSLEEVEEAQKTITNHEDQEKEVRRHPISQVFIVI